MTKITYSNSPKNHQYRLNRNNSPLDANNTDHIHFYPKFNTRSGQVLNNQHNNPKPPLISRQTTLAQRNLPTTVEKPRYTNLTSLSKHSQPRRNISSDQGNGTLPLVPLISTGVSQNDVIMVITQLTSIISLFVTNMTPLLDSLNLLNGLSQQLSIAPPSSQTNLALPPPVTHPTEYPNLPTRHTTKSPKNPEDQPDLP